MNRLRLGVRLESLGLPFRRGLVEAARLGVGGVELDAVGDFAPRELSQTGRRELRHLLRSHNLELTALGCPLRRGLDIAENQEARIDRIKDTLALSFELGPRITIIHAGQVPEEKDTDRYARFTEALTALARHGDRIGAVLALETGLESGQVLGQLIDRVGSGGLGVSFNPANLLVHGFEPLASARALAGRIVHLHATDARAARASRAAQEVPLGHGDIDWLAFLGLLEAIEYRGWATIERETGDNRLADIAEGVAFLRRLGVAPP